MPQTVAYRCTNRYGEPKLGIEKCRDYGSKNHPDNLVQLEAAKLPPPGIAPKCPCCGRDLAPVKGGTGTGTVVDPSRGGWKKVAVVAVALAVVAGVGYLVFSMAGSPKMQLSVEKLMLNNLHPSDTLEITNVGSGTLKVKVLPGRDAIIVSPETLEIKPNQTGSVDVSIADPAAKLTRIDAALELQTSDPKFAKFPVALTWRNLNGVLDQVFGQAHENLYPKKGGID